MSLDKSEKLQMIDNRREGPERHKYSAELDLKIAKASGDEGAAEDAQSRLDAANDSLKILNDEAKSLK